MLRKSTSKGFFLRLLSISLCAIGPSSLIAQAQSGEEEFAQNYENCYANRDAEACASLEYWYLAGYGGDDKYEGAMRAYDKACEYGDALRCHSLGESYRYGFSPFFIAKDHDLEADMARARGYYAKGCELGEERSCEALQAMIDG